MKFRFAALATALLLTSTTSFAGVVTSSSNVDFLAIDGQKASKSLLKSTNSFNASESQLHQVVVRVSEVIRTGGSERSLFESDPIIVTFQGHSDDLVISAPHIENDREAADYNDHPVIYLKTVSGQAIPFKLDKLKQEGFLPGLNLIDNLSEYNASGAVAAVSSFAVNMMPSVVPTMAKAQKGKITVQGENVVEQQLQYWFQQADKETQKRFLNWATKQK
ncbi:curli polymerization inhibitor CsgI-related protein [Avibacterium paragallinarum]|uniref:UPF0319 protein DM482_11230 n=1 Tax=Avibacterium paragallinarum TaxID=728 RepID=A0A0F5EQU4_AVIPA|nr:DUF2057 domain-containing protein [Avibacterium paragallinarum]AZI14087.1 DUF2057 domain-containing protein [Avibacterium paragallinarum]KAA6209385.1 DUF2057 domain-containing protein [Avibacterium paragallinarum]KKB02462.1 hypothetical protein Z012_00720 [Avibacterium paragallinarum]MEE3608527.1 DUF2057 domain-containing protein [Avibacterium paragallinarum]MEE3620904.1 DUF2057 domain-containing protein [Avibacterium paragallinarum]